MQNPVPQWPGFFIPQQQNRDFCHDSETMTKSNETLWLKSYESVTHYTAPFAVHL